MFATPEFFPHSYDPAVDMTYLVRLSEAEFRAASFLDQRVLARGKGGDWLTWPDLWRRAGLADGNRRGCNYIFHISHVGSTLMSRLLGEHRRIFALREPAVLRTLAGVEIDVDSPHSEMGPDRFDERLAQLTALLGRTWRPEQTALVKGTSIVSALASRLTGAGSGTRALLMYAPPEPFLASILGASNSIHDIRDQAPLRLRRLHRAIGVAPWRLWALSTGELIAMSWAAEMVDLAQTAADWPDRTLTLDFERFLGEPAASLLAAFAFLGAPAAPMEVEALVRSPIMGRYAKAPEHAYDARLRREVLDQGRRDEPEALRAGLAWLEAAAAAYPEIARALAMGLSSAPA